MLKSHEEREPSWRELCAIALSQIQADPTIDDSEWADRIKWRLIRLGLDYPDPLNVITSVMRAVERTFQRRPRTQEKAAAGIDDAKVSRAEAKEILERLGFENTLKPMPNVRLMTLREAERQKAARILAQGILEQIQRCEEAERAIEPKPEPE